MAMDLDPQDEMDVFEELPYEFVLLNYTRRLDTHFQYKAKGCFHRKKSRFHIQLGILAFVSILTFIGLSNTLCRCTNACGRLS